MPTARWIRPRLYKSDGSSVITLYSATGVKLVETAYHADRSKDVWTYNIKGQNYTTQHDVYDRPDSSRP